MVHLFRKKVLTKAEQRKKDIQDYRYGFDKGYGDGKKNSGWISLSQDSEGKWYEPENPYDKGYIDGAKKGLKIFARKEKRFQKHLGSIAKIAKRKR